MSLLRRITASEVLSWWERSARKSASPFFASVSWELMCPSRREVTATLSESRRTQLISSPMTAGVLPSRSERSRHCTRTRSMPLYTRKSWESPNISQSRSAAAKAPSPKKNTFILSSP